MALKLSKKKKKKSKQHRNRRGNSSTSHTKINLSYRPTACREEMIQTLQKQSLPFVVKLITRWIDWRNISSRFCRGSRLVAKRPNKWWVRSLLLSRSLYFSLSRPPFLSPRDWFYGSLSWSRPQVVFWGFFGALVHFFLSPFFLLAPVLILNWQLNWKKHPKKWAGRRSGAASPRLVSPLLGGVIYLHSGGFWKEWGGALKVIRRL